jgi:hypothetical protein
MKEIVLTPSKTRLLVLLAGAIGFVAVGAFLVWMIRTPVAIVAGVAAILFFGACFLRGLQALFSRGFDLVINDFGVNDRNNGLGQIPWTEIDGFDIRGEKLFIKIKHISDYRSRMSGFRRWMSQIDGDLELGIITVNLSILDITSTEMLKLLEASGNVNRDRIIDSTTLDPSVHEH